MREILIALLLLSVFTVGGTAQESYSPHVNIPYPTRAYWGDTHVHTALSGDAFSLGARLTSYDAYRFAKGETVRSTGEEDVRLRRPLDFLMVADHAENLGVIPRVAAGDESIPESGQRQRWYEVFAGLRPLSEVLNAETSEDFLVGVRSLNAAKGAWQGDYGIDESFRRTVWEEIIASAERHNDPGNFTAFIGYEWSGRANGPMIHRNVLFEGGGDEATQVLPYSRFDSDDPEDLWAYLDDFESRVGGQVMSIPHNSNLSGGQMFRLSTDQGQSLTNGYAQTRARWEPIIEVTQIKGDSETHPLVSPTDEFAGFESFGRKATVRPAGKVKPSAKSKKQSGISGKPGAASPETDPIARERSSYARSALKLGLGQKATLGVNPFKFGMIGSTDSHTGLATADDDNFWGKMGGQEPSAYRVATQGYFSSSGYAAVWAIENTRASLFAAMKRREVYATTGPRIAVRFFGGWDYAADDAFSPELAAVGYRGGVPMGGDLTGAPEGMAPRFLIRVVKDPDGANLDRVQVIKGWRSESGDLEERVYHVALSDGRAVDRKGNAEPVGSTVNLEEATYLNTIGDPELSVVWEDPDFNPGELAFYYLRVIEIPTPRWTAYDAKFYRLNDIPEGTIMVTQERAYTSPIWYTP